MNRSFVIFKYRDFKYFLGVQFLYTAAVLIQEVILGFYLYELTGDPLTLGIIGLLEAVPYLFLALYGGHIADQYEKKNIAKICISFMAILSTALVIGLQHLTDSTSIKYLIYGIVFSIGLCRGFMGPSWSSMKPFLVAKEHYADAAIWASQFWQMGMLFGPAISGFLYAYLGLKTTLSIVAMMFLICLLLVFLIQVNAKADQKEKQNIWASLREGFSFVRRTKIFIYAMALDMFSVLFGGVIALLPVFAKDILHVGPEGLGIMRAAPGIGAVLTMLLMTRFSPVKQAWRNMLLAVLGFGIATFVFAISKNFTLSVVALFLTGAFDSISVVVRQTILNVLPPEEMRGRVTSINGLFVSCSNELGAFESGVAAKLMGTVNSVIFGAGMTIFFIVIIYLKTKDLMSINLLNHQKKQ